MNYEVAYRSATPNDSRFIAEMVALASDGIASLEWAEDCDKERGQTVLDIGSLNYKSDKGDYSYRNCIIAEVEEHVGMILSFPITDENSSKDAKPPPYEPDDFYAPYQYLEALNSWYICGVAVLPKFRKREIGRHLIQLSAEQAQKKGFKKVSLIAMYEKSGLIRYYQSLGFEITRSAPIVEHPQINAKGDAVLMEASLPLKIIND